MITFLTGIAGAIAISGAIIGCFFIPANFLERLVLFGSALCLIDAKSMTNYLGLAGLLIVIGWQLAKKRHKQAFQ
jgi:TRAP-type uncharacterized transport system fused permease subunit